MSIPTALSFFGLHLSPGPGGRNASTTLFECMKQLCEKTGPLLKVRRNTVVFNQGTRLSCLYLIKSGCAG